LLAATALVAYADGAHIALHATSGDYTITVFTAPDPLVAGPVDISVLVQDRATDTVLGDARVTATLSGVGEPLHLDLTHVAASNKLLLAANPVLDAAGSYNLQFQVERPEAPAASFSVTLPVSANHRRRTTLLFSLALPLAAILLFLVNQQVKRKASLRRRLPLS
jgi:hypothetical protein